MYVVKASGARQPFDEAKLRRSLSRSGADRSAIDEIVRHVGREVRDGVSTHRIYNHAFSLLRRQHRGPAVRYGLRRGLFDLGPSGFAFETYVGEVLRHEGFKTELRVVVPGICVRHEVDVVGKKQDRHILVECKFHNQAGMRSDIKTALYVQARFDDIRRRYERDPKHLREFHEIWLVTNTKVSHDAVQYAECVGMKLVSWEYPKGDSLRERIERGGLHPITCLTTLTQSQKAALLQQGILLAKTIAEHPNVLGAIDLTGPRAAKVAAEAAMVTARTVSHE